MSSGLLVSVLIGGLGIGGAVGYIAGAATKAPSHQVANVAGQDTAWFVYDGKTYDTSSLPSQVQTNIYQTELQSYNQKMAIIREFAVRIALAQEQKKFTTPDKLPSLDELLPPANVTDEQAKAFFEANKDKIPPGTDYNQLAPRIKEHLANEGRGKVFEDTWQKLTTSNKLQILAKEPQSPIVDIPVDQFPQHGAADKKNVLVEVSDYLCPHCQEAQPVMKKLLEKYKDKIKFVQINYALRPANLSGALVEGAFCAQQQGVDAFWKYHETAFSQSWGNMQDPYDIEKAKPIAEKAGLKLPEWETCMKAPEAKANTEKTRETVAALGVTGTPTFYLNNKRLSVRNPAAELEAAVEAALAK